MMKKTLPSNERSLVTFAVFAYNQERFVREAIEGAFAQTYHPLEIVLSDDSSTDRTFAIMQKAAAAYDGPHQVRVRRSVRNVGLLNHILDVAGVANGDLLIVAAGDDVSLPKRTVTLVESWRSRRSGALYSAYVPMGNDSALLERDPKAQGLERTIPYLGGNGENIPLVLGATAAYDVDLLRNIPRPSAKIFHEDIIFTNVARLHGYDISYVDTPLVMYRFADLSRTKRLTIRDAFYLILDWEMRANHRIRDYRGVLDYMEALFAAEDGLQERRVLSTQRSENAFMNDFVTGSLFQRLHLISTCRNGTLLRWACPRLFGLRVFSASKAAVLQVRERART
jgi:cellulose synthase/poly-beta-1,6-N-acetylglucosamine synthase-like glycosyltransferase